MKGFRALFFSVSSSPRLGLSASLCSSCWSNLSRDRDLSFEEEQRKSKKNAALKHTKENITRNTMAPSVSRSLRPVFLLLLLTWPTCAQTTVGVTTDEVRANDSSTTNSTESASPDPKIPFTGNTPVQGSTLNTISNLDNDSTAGTRDTGQGQSTPGYADVTATSQRIFLQTTSVPVAKESSTSHQLPANTAPHATTDAATISANAPFTATPGVAATEAPATATPLVAMENGSRAATEPTDGPAEGNSTVRESETPGEQNGTGDGLLPRRLLLLTFNGTCDYDSSSVAGQLEELGGANTVGAGFHSCESQVRLRLTVSNVSGDLDRLVGVLQLRTSESLLTLSAVEFPDRPLGTSDRDEEGLVTRLFAGPFSTREIITYAVVGSVFGLAILLVAALLCCKCCCGNRQRKRSQDIPHLTLRLEDYSLTRIPRPNTLFSGGGGGVAGALRNGSADGVRQSIDTSVVPIEEDFGSLRRSGLRSFSGRRPGHRAPDEEDALSRCSPALTGSTERLARDFGNRRQQPKRGNDNKNFRF